MCESHDWRPVPTWVGRYQCRACRCFGYRGVVTNDALGLSGPMIPNKPPGAILPYHCHCGAPGMAKRHTRDGRPTTAWLCWTHHQEAQAKLSDYLNTRRVPRVYRSKLDKRPSG
jgi:hypothetical protein